MCDAPPSLQGSPVHLGLKSAIRLAWQAHLRRSPSLQQAFVLAFNLLDGACSPPFWGESLTAASQASEQTIVAFDSLASRYDDLFSRSRIGTQRGAVWEVLADTFRPGDEILLLNCRTREDAIFLAMLDVSVVACDAREGMVQTGLNPLIQLDLVAAEHLSKHPTGALFDGALSKPFRIEWCRGPQSGCSRPGVPGYHGGSPHHLPFQSVL